MKQILLLTTALIWISGTGSSLPAFAAAAKAPGHQVVESRVVHVRGNQVSLHDGTTLTVPRYVADPTEIQGGDTVKFTYEVKNGRKIATSIRFIDRPSGGIKRW